MPGHRGHGPCRPRWPTPTHDAAAATIGRTTFVFGGGSPNTVATVQAVATPRSRRPPARTGTVVGQLPQPRSDLAVATVTAGRGTRATTTAYLVGGYDGTTYLPGVLATTDGTHFTTVARLSVPVRYPAVVAAGGMVYCFGGQTASPAAPPPRPPTPSSGSTRPPTGPPWWGTSPRPSTAPPPFVLGGTIYVAGGQSPGGPTLTQITAFVPSSGKVLHAGLLPQATRSPATPRWDRDAGAIGYVVGGEVTAQTGTDQAGVASGSLSIGDLPAAQPLRWAGRIARARGRRTRAPC